MSYHYSDPSRESDAHALPDVEVFTMAYRHCPSCHSLMQDEDAAGNVVCLDETCDNYATRMEPSRSGWFYWFCFPGCLPHGDPIGPFDTEAAALADARKDN